MKIAITLLKYNPYGGYERQAAALAEGLAARGDEVTIYSHSWKSGGSAGIRFHRVPVIGWTPWLRVMSFALMSRRYIREAAHTFDIVVAFDRTLEMDIYRAGNACHREWTAFRKEYMGLHSRLSIAVNPLHPVVNWIEKRIFRRIQQRGGYIVVLSPLGAEQIRKHYHVDEDRFVVIPSAVDPGRFNRDVVTTYREEMRKTLGIDEDTLILLHVGSGFRIKGLISTIRSMPLLLKKGVRAALVIVGKDRLRTRRYKKLCRRLGIERHVHFLGGVAHVERCYAAADIFVLPTLFETFCISAIEALSCGLPVIIGKGAGASSIIEKAGSTIDVPAAPEELAARIEETAAEENRLRASGEIEAVYRHRIETASQCGLEHTVSRFCDLIDRAAKGGNAGD